MTRGKLTRARRRTHPRSGFTLIEVLLVLIILVILGSLATGVFTGTQEQASKRAVASQVGFVDEAIGRYRMDFNKNPDELSDLWDKPSDSDDADKWAGPYMKELKNDPWGNEYQYAAKGKKNSDGYDFWSTGPDGKDGTEDDIGNWDDE
ncbi:MAG: type II secretion system protein GspG [Planctomycetaceae bacterium]|nr:type II secretion system protein GspG [Planctomycetaceae bacterium]